jgi:uncharacterized protein (UPF0333 family)
LPEEVRNEKNHYPKCKPLHQGIWENKQQGWSTQNTAAKKTNQIILMNAWAEITFRTLIWFDNACMWNNDNTYRQVYMDDDTCKPFEEKLIKQKGSIFVLNKTVFCK